VTTARAILGERAGTAFDQTSSRITTIELKELLAWLGPLPLVSRQSIRGLPPARADVFPAALTTLLALAEAGGLSALVNSLYNLRYGLADEALASLTGTS
jgi:exopolyphosphatase / guanosine-5'-triphosphate,3'-diphosphate pyrophosphatase